MNIFQPVVIGPSAPNPRASKGSTVTLPSTRALVSSAIVITPQAPSKKYYGSIASYVT
jgi:hypothetical protein